MPTARKRIGFLPSTHIQNIINKICIENNLSQSKVTGILVEEALTARKLYNINKIEEENKEFFKKDIKNYKINKSFNSYSEENNSRDFTNDNEYKLIKEYLNYKNFKMILSKVELEE